MTQLNASLTKESLDKSDKRNETLGKLCKNTSDVFRSCDTGDGYMNTRREIKTLSKQPEPAVERHLIEVLHILRAWEESILIPKHSKKCVV